jgi:hypothetical protein
VLSHRAAGALRELVGTFSPTIDVTSPRRLDHPGIRAHRSLLHPDDTATHECGLRTTSVERTLIDLAATMPLRQLERAVDQAEVRHLLSLDALDAALRRAPRKPGTAALRRIVWGTAKAPAFTRSELEEAFLAIVAGAGLPEPVTNGRVLGIEVDFHWPDRRLIVETDGGRWHGTPRRIAKDKRRDALFVTHGWHTLRFTDHDIASDAGYVRGVLASMFSRM